MAITEQLETLPQTADVIGLDLSGLLLSLILENDVTTINALKALATKIEDIAYWDAVLAATPDVHGGTWVKYNLLSSDLTSGNSETLTIFTAAANTAIDTAFVKHSTAFAGAGLSSLTVKVGVAGDTQKYVPAFDIVQAVSDTAKTSVNVADFEPSSVAVQALFEGNGGADFSILTDGSVDIYIKHSVLP